MMNAKGYIWVILVLIAARVSAVVEVKDWEFSQTMSVNTSGVVKVEVPLATLDRAAADGRDVRLLGPGGAEVAYAWVEPGAVQPDVRPAKRFDFSLTDDAVVAVIETGSDRPLKNLRLMATTGRFIKAAEVEVSADGVRWEALVKGVPFLRMDGVERFILPLGGRVAAWVRVTMAGQRRQPIVLVGAYVEEASGLEGEREEWEVALVRREEFEGESVLTLDFGAANVALTELVVRAEDAVYSRQVWLGRSELEDEKAVERIFAQGMLAQLALDGASRTGIDAIWVGDRLPARVLNLHVVNGDSAPLRIQKIMARRTPRQAVFYAETAGEYRWLSGNSQVRAPKYDIGVHAANLAKAAESGAGIGRVGELTRNPDFTAPDAMAGLTLEGGHFDAAGWTQQRAVVLGGPGVQWLELDAEVLAGARDDLGDLRLVRAGKQVPYLIERTKLSRAVDVVFSEERVAKQPTLSRWLLKLPHAGMPVTQLRLEAGARLFDRSLVLYEQRSGRNGDVRASLLGEGAWRREPTNAEQAGRVTVSERPAAEVLQLETENGDNPPIGLRRVQAIYPVTRLLFQASGGPENGGVIELWYGNSSARPPRYDVGLVAGSLLAAERHQATLTEGKTRTAIPDQTRWKIGGWVLWVGLALVVVVLLVIVAKLLPKEPGR